MDADHRVTRRSPVEPNRLAVRYRPNMGSLVFKSLK